jgi:uncharacterized protein
MDEVTEEPVGQVAESPLDVLLRVQDLDTAIAQLEHRKATLPERAQLDGLDEQIEQLDRQMAVLGRERQELLDRQEALDEQVSALTARRRTLEDQLYSARGSAARDLQAMEGEVQHLTRRRAELESVELELLEQQEGLEAQLASMAGERAELDQAAQTVRGALDAAQGEVDGEIASVAASRGSEVRRLPVDLADRYETIRARLGGIGAARLAGSRCSGCHLELPAMEVDRIRHLPAETVVTCDQCGRILVRPSGATG